MGDIGDLALDLLREEISTYTRKIKAALALYSERTQHGQIRPHVAILHNGWCHSMEWTVALAREEIERLKAQGYDCHGVVIEENDVDNERYASWGYRYCARIDVNAQASLDEQRDSHKQYVQPLDQLRELVKQLESMEI